MLVIGFVENIVHTGMDAEVFVMCISQPEVCKRKTGCFSFLERYGDPVLGSDQPQVEGWYQPAVHEFVKYIYASLKRRYFR